MPILFGSDIELPRDPQEALHAATKQYVDAGLTGKAASSHTQSYTTITGWGVVVLLMMCLQNFCRYKITLDNQGVQYRRSWFGIGWNRVWRYTDFAKVTAEYRTLKFLQLDMIRNPELGDAGDGRTNPYPFAIRFLSADDEPLGTIPDLLENEAILIAKQIRQKTTQPIRCREEGGKRYG